MAREIDYYFSLQSPWAYIGNTLFHDLAARHGLTVNYKPVLLGELFAETGGLPLVKRHPARQRYRMMELQRWRDKRGLPFDVKPKHWPFNSRLVDGVAVAAIDESKNPEPFLSKVFTGIWEGNLDLGDPAVVAKLANDSGLPGEKLVARSPSGEISALYEKNRQDAIEAGVFGSPAWVLDGEVFWGQDRIELLDDALKSGRKAYTSEI